MPSNIFIDPEQLGKDKKSVTYTITFQHSSKTLEDKFVNEVINEIIHSAEEKFFAIKNMNDMSLLNELELKIRELVSLT